VASREPVVLSDPKAIRALAHPARLAVIEELYTGRELTATECAEIAGLSPSAMSYHLRNLERAGIVERADATGDGRERPWRAAGSYLRVESSSYAAEAAALSTTVLSRLNEQFAEWLARRSEEVPAWRDASTVSSGQVWLTVDELDSIGETVAELVNSFRDRAEGERPEGARRVRFTLITFPSDAPTTLASKVEQSRVEQ
jgi:DNA-binding transcriptional ArsR family regulator